jgi:hypothetical protein
MKNKVAFDFDCTLDKSHIQDYAAELIERGLDVWIITARLSPEESQRDWNKDLFEISDALGIIRENIIFTAYCDKYEIIKDNDFIFHIDDDWTELELIKEHTDCIPVSSFGNKYWRYECDQAILNRLK